MQETTDARYYRDKTAALIGGGIWLTLALRPG
jgi:hypothetical protein